MLLPPPPLRFQTKLLCFSLFYLFTSLFLALYLSLISTRCIIQSRPSDLLIQTPLFSYPSTYGEHKYALPIHHSSCDSPVQFSDYGAALEDIREFGHNSSQFSSALIYMEEKTECFGGNFSTHDRRLYFNHDDDQLQVPCGFMKDFLVSDNDRLAMEGCNEMVVVSAIFGDHDKIRQPRGLGAKTLAKVCFFMFVDEATVRGLNSHGIRVMDSSNLSSPSSSVGVWRVVRVLGELPYTNPAMNGVIPKHLIHRLFPNSKFSIWMDAKLQLTVDPLLLIHSLILKKDADMAIAKHPFNVHAMEEAIATARWRKWGDIEALESQMGTYCENGLEPWTPKKLPYTTDVPDTALILRKHGLATNLFSCLLFNELEAFNPRDQLAFAYVRDLMKPRIKINMFETQVFEHIAMEYRHNLKKVGDGSSSSSTKRLLKKNWTVSETAIVAMDKCEEYLSKMWEESPS